MGETVDDGEQGNGYKRKERVVKNRGPAKHARNM